MGHVIHVSSDVHERAQAYCKKHNIQLKAWTEKLLIGALSESQKPIENPIVKPTPKPVGVKKEKTLSEGKAQFTGGDSDQSDVWQRPPFWAVTNRDDSKAEESELDRDSPGSSTSSSKVGGGSIQPQEGK